MAVWRVCSLFNNKQAVTILLWYVITCLILWLSDFQLPPTTVVGVIALKFSVITIIYSVLGLFADAFIGRYRLIQFSLWIQWITAIISTFILAMSEYCQIHTWMQSMIILTLCVIGVLGLSSFQVVAIQFGIDQLQGASSQILSAFIFWYFMIEILLIMMIWWSFYLLSFSKNETITARGPLAWNLLSAILVSIALCIKNCFMSKWFLKESTVSDTSNQRDCKTDNSNPYRLIYSVLKFAKQHKCPIQRSALTYWEDEIPSRIDLGKRKYGGPFTTEEVENVKTFLQLLKVLLSLSGILVTSFIAQVSIRTFDINITTAPGGNNYMLIMALCQTAIVGLLILSHIFLSFCKCHLSMLKRIGIGSALTIICVLSILLINCIRYTKYHINIIAYLNLIIPNILFELSYIVFTVSLLEFIIAQSPHTMKGILIGFYYVIRYGVAGLLTLIEHLSCTYIHSAMSCNKIITHIVITIIALLSFIVYCFLACKYKLRERDEVVNVHIFAEEYYGKREDDSITD